MKENIVIIGGGIAGMEAASQLLDLGYKPIIIEKSDHLGGHVAEWNCLFPDMTPAGDVVKTLVTRSAGANIFLNTEISFVNKLKDSYNIMLSNGISIITKIILVTTGFSVSRLVTTLSLLPTPTQLSLTLLTLSVSSEDS